MKTSNNPNPKRKTQDAQKRRLQRVVRRLACPFCKQKRLFAWGPDDAISRPWWVVGCESVRCDSTWRIERNNAETIIEMLENTKHEAN